MSLAALAVSVLISQAPATPAQLKWLAGSWRTTDAKHNASSEEVWVFSETGLFGMYREVMGGKPGFYELSSIVPEGDTLVLSMRMFDRALKDAKKTAGGPLRFVLESTAFHKATFKGDGPNNEARLTYELVNPHTLHVMLDRADGAPPEQLDFSRFFN
ncbi:MAG: hypothetical protein JNK82_35345 [Myxococcaceae bacterium]|nr:hypothetical protein [Myxococcaceae bacterium]